MGYDQGRYPDPGAVASQTLVCGVCSRARPNHPEQLGASLSSGCRACACSHGPQQGRRSG